MSVFGKTTTGARNNGSFGGDGIAKGSYYTCTEAGQATSISVRLNRSSNADVKLAIYRKSTGALVGYTESLTVTSTGLKEFDITNGGILVAADYWLIAKSNGTTVYLYRDWPITSAGSYKESLTYGDDWPTTWSSYTSTGDQIDVYCTYTSAATVTTQAVSAIDTTSATGNGNITDEGDANVTTKGFCYKEGDTGDPTTTDSTAFDTGSFSTGAYTKGLTGLSSGTDYRVRAYAISTGGTAYGATVDLTTLSAGNSDFFQLF